MTNTELQHLGDLGLVRPSTTLDSQASGQHSEGRKLRLAEVDCQRVDGALVGEYRKEPGQPSA